MVIYLPGVCTHTLQPCVLTVGLLRGAVFRAVGVPQLELPPVTARLCALVLSVSPRAGAGAAVGNKSGAILPTHIGFCKSMPVRQIAASLLVHDFSMQNHANTA